MGDSEYDPEVSIHAITGTHGAKTIQVKGSILQHSLLTLIDSRSTHFFLDQLLVLALDIQMERKQAI